MERKGDKRPCDMAVSDYLKGNNLLGEKFHGNVECWGKNKKRKRSDQAVDTLVDTLSPINKKTGLVGRFRHLLPNDDCLTIWQPATRCVVGSLLPL